MKKKVLAFLLASAMVIEPFSVVGAADFSDGMGQDTVQFSDDAEDVPKVETEDADQFSTEAVAEGENSSKPSEDAIQMGDDVWVTFDDSTGTATISGTGDMWDYYENGKDFSNTHQNPFIGKTGINKIVIENGVTSVGNLLLNQYNDKTSIEEISLGEDIKRIGKFAFRGCSNIKKILLPTGLEEIDERVFCDCSNLESIEIPDSVKNLGEWCFAECNALQKVELPSSLKNIPDYAFFECGLKEVVLPLDLESLGNSAFASCPLKEISFPSSLKSMGSSIFEYCSLTKVNFAEGFSCNISDFVFDSCRDLEEIVIPESVQEIQINAFYCCSNLMKITIKGVATYVDSNAFRGCPNIRIIKGHDCSYIKKYYDSLSKSQQKEIEFESLGEGSHQFTAEKVQTKEPTCTEKGIKAYRCEICGKTKDEEELPAYDHNWNNGVITKQATETEEGEIKYTCRRCNETKIEKIPKLSTINFKIDKYDQDWNGHYQYRFRCTSNKDVTYYVECVKKDSKPPTYDSARKDGEIMANGGRWNIYADVTDEDAVDIYVFATNANGDYVCVKVTPNNNSRPEKPVYKVGKNVTASIEGDTLILSGTGETYDNIWWGDSDGNELNKDNIKHIIVEEGITSLEELIFYGFRKLEDIQLPTSLKSIGYGAFKECDSLKELTIPEGVTNIGNGIINSCTSMKKISLPSTLNTIPRLIMESTGDMQLDEIVLNKGIETIGNSAFWNLKNIKNITIPDSVTTIEDNAFNNCVALIDLVLPDSIVEIGGCAFSNCASLDKVTLPKNLASLGCDAFEYCNAEIIFPSSLNRIPELGNNAVKKVTISEGVETIGYRAFGSCGNLTEITLPSTIKNIESEAFEGTGITSFNYPQNIKYIPNSVFANTSLEEFSVPESVTEINDNAFGNCTKLTKISIPKSVTYIGSDVFKYCRNLTVYGYKDSAIESYAKANAINFISADYKVVFKDNGRTQKTEYVTSGQNATPPTLSSKPGYTLSWDADYTNVTEDMVINAVWTKKDSSNGGGNTTIIVSPSETNKYTVTFKDRGKIVKTEKVKSGDAAEYPYISRNGYELSWDKDFSKVTTDITVNAVWTVIKPNKVTSLTAEVQKNSIDLSWDRAENTDYYLVYRKATSDTEYKQIKKTTRILWADENVEPGTEYSYKVVGVCSVDGKKYQGADSDIVTAKIGTPQIGDVYSVGDLKYKVTGAKEVSVIGLAKVTDTLTIPSSVTISGKVYKVTSVQAKAFYQNENIVSIAIGNNVTYVGKYAFYQCPNLETVKFGKRVSVISTCAFTQCPNLENVTLPSSIRRIGAKAFYQCTSVKVLKINGSDLEYVGKKGLAVNKTVTLRLPKKVYTRYKELIKTSNIYSKTKFIKF